MKHILLFENYSEDDVDFIIAKIIDNFPYEDTKMRMESDDDSDHDTILIDMINWFETEFDREIDDEMLVMNRLKEEYDFLNND